MTFLIGYLFVVNGLGFSLMWIDKQRAKRHQWRISEATLQLVAWLGGGPAMLVARQTIRHKSQKLLFLVSFVGATIFWIILSLLYTLVAFGVISLFNY